MSHSLTHSFPPQHVSAGTMYKLTILGDGGVGKTALVIQLCLNRFVETYDPTIEDSYRKRVLLDGRASTLEIMDTAGQEEYSTLRDQWIRDGEGFLLVYSITQRSSFERVRQYHEEIIRLKDGEPFGLVLVGNKCDEEELREVNPTEGESLARSWGIPFFETSAKLDINSDFAFLQAARLTRDTRDHESPPSSRSSFERGDQPRQGSYSSMQSEYSNTYSALTPDNSNNDNTQGVPAAALMQPTSHNQKPPLLTHRSGDSLNAPPEKFEAAQQYSMGSPNLQKTTTARNQHQSPSAAYVRSHAGSINDSDGGDTIVARPRGRKKKGKCSIM